MSRAPGHRKTESGTFPFFGQPEKARCLLAAFSRHSPLAARTLAAEREATKGKKRKRKKGKKQKERARKVSQASRKRTTLTNRTCSTSSPTSTPTSRGRPTAAVTMSPPAPWGRLLSEGPRDAGDVSALCDLLSPARDLGRRLRRDEPGDRAVLTAAAALAADFLCSGCHLTEGAAERAAVLDAGRAIVDFVVRRARGGVEQLPKVRGRERSWRWLRSHRHDVTLILEPWREGPAVPAVRPVLRLPRPGQARAGLPG